METLKDFFIAGYKVSDTMRKGIIDPTIYNNSNNELMLGNLAALGGSATWLMVATFFKLPISGTHSIVGATIGFSLVARGMQGVQWIKLAQIVASWFISPVLSGLMSAGLYVLIRRLILRKPAPLEYGLRALPIFYALTLAVNIFSIMLDGPKLLYFDRIPWWGTLAVSCALGFITGLVVHFFTVPRIRKSILDDTGIAGGRAKFTFGEGGESGPGSAASSNSATPNGSRNVSMDNLPYSRVQNELEPAGSDLHSRNHKKSAAPAARKPIRFGFRKSQVLNSINCCLQLQFKQ